MNNRDHQIQIEQEERSVSGCCFFIDIFTVISILYHKFFLRLLKEFSLHYFFLYLLLFHLGGQSILVDLK